MQFRTLFSPSFLFFILASTKLVAAAPVPVAYAYGTVEPAAAPQSGPTTHDVSPTVSRTRNINPANEL